jgi:hypothetical protein
VTARQARLLGWRAAGYLAALGALPACSAPRDDVVLGLSRAAVRGGTESLACEWPAVVGTDLGCSGVLVHPEVVLYAAHCGAGVREIYFGADLDSPAGVARTRACEVHPDAALGNGLDVAFCWLAEPADFVEPLRLAAGCELDSVRTGESAVLVGFGPEVPDGAFGIKRSASVTLAAIAPDLTLAPGPSGTCAGDSGGPLLVELPAPSGTRAREQRVFGIVSAAESASCEPSTDHFSYLPPLISWLEDTSGRDLTPCFDAAGAWSPTPECTETASQRANDPKVADCAEPVPAPFLAETCGDAFPRGRLADATPPELDLVMSGEGMTLHADERGFAETSLDARAFDAESGVAEVAFEVVDAEGSVRAEHRDEVPPYLLEGLRLPAGEWDVVVSARDHADNETQRRLSFSVVPELPHASCAMAAGPARRAPRRAAWVLFFAVVGARARRRVALAPRFEAARAMHVPHELQMLQSSRPSTGCSCPATTT